MRSSARKNRGHVPKKPREKANQLGPEERRRGLKRLEEERTQRKRRLKGGEDEKIEWEVIDSFGVFKDQMDLMLRQAVKVVPLVIPQYSSS